MTHPNHKLPESVLVVVHTPDYQILLLERCQPCGFWQSVTGSLEAGETPFQTALRELGEETGLHPDPQQLREWQRSHRFEIHAQWRDRYAPGVTHNTEHVFSLCLPAPRIVRLAPHEHRAQRWLPAAEAARVVFSHTNREAIVDLVAQAREPPGA